VLLIAISAFSRFTQSPEALGDLVAYAKIIRVLALTLIAHLMMMPAGESIHSATLDMARAACMFWVIAMPLLELFENALIEYSFFYPNQPLSDSLHEAWRIHWLRGLLWLNQDDDDSDDMIDLDATDDDLDAPEPWLVRQTEKGLKRIIQAWASFSDEDCSVCLQTMSKEQVIRTPCQHHFHHPCFAKWARSNLLVSELVICPLCRAELPLNAMLQ
jgi:hypothetical protein